MTIPMIDDPAFETLEQRNDDDLRALIGQATDILASRENKRRQEAIAAIRRMAQENGLAITVAPAKPRRRRRRKDAA